MLEKNSDRVKVVIKHFPLQNHPFSMRGAQGAMAAQKQGKFAEYHKLVFANYKDLNNDKFLEFAKQIGLDPARFTQDMNSPEVMQLIRRDVGEGQQSGVRGTPTIYVNGWLLRERSEVGIQQLLDRDLPAAGAEDTKPKVKEP